MVELREFYFMLLHLVAKYFMNMSYKLLQFSEPRFSVLPGSSSLNFGHDIVCFVAVRVPSVVDGTCTWREGRWTRVPSWAVPPPIKVSKSPVTQVVRQSVLRIDVEGVNLWEKLTNLRLQMRRGKVTQLPEARAPLTRLHHPVWSHNQIFSNFFWGGSRIFV